ncbi:quinoprotein relay system zinc metallohydrolase 1 [Azospirillum sp. RWY-5-1]|uniref:Quinoprotein relay system zinc metallohydrolase 1 n=1 Tax=Azospirillum oleiclasticum TaxID=2735135 RepID=A0ABX2T9H4_9PROT|nr:quinoprotein relay system zinc metallohydrolase 1 [Azospirillum oleiclasticum]NYZ19912.1 quinoprotein relay system zinc metallohydrolase 1 [Azospirillum oleiclasticum]
MTRLLVLLAVLLAAGAGRPASALTYGLTPVRIAEDTWVFVGGTDHFTRANGGNILNPGFIVTGDGVVVIQTGPSRRFGEEMRAAIRKVTAEPIRIVYVGNLHPDYFLGAQAFPDVPVAALPGTIDGIRNEGAAIAGNMYRLVGDWMRGTEPVTPSHAVRGSTVVIGTHRLRLIERHGHTAADLAILDETTGVLFAGGLVFSDRTPTTPHADIPAWLASLDALAGLEFTTLVPNHGRIRSGADAHAAIAETRDWLTWLDGTLRAAAAEGRDMAEMLDHPIPERFHRMNVLRAEYQRSVAHLWPAIERETLPRIR